MMVDMSTVIWDLSRRDTIEAGEDLQVLLCALETNSSLFRQEQLRARLDALDALDVAFGNCDPRQFMKGTNSRMSGRAKALRHRLEAANEALCQSLRSKLVAGGQPCELLQWLHSLAGRKDFGNPPLGLGFDSQDEFVSGIFQFREPGEPKLQPSPEMVPYQPTPVRHILHLMEAGALSGEDVFVDLGSGLGHVPLLVSMLAGVQSIGIEVNPAYVICAQECAQSLQLRRARFLTGDARTAELSSGTVFYLYSPFTGSILTDVLNRLHAESTRRSIKIFSLGPCTLRIKAETWLKASALPDPERITIFESRCSG
jgi:Histone methylation protein DOT1